MKRITAILLLLTLSFLLASCGKKEAMEPADWAAPPDMAWDGDMKTEANGFSSDHSAADAAQYGLMMTYSADLSLETKDFDACQAALLDAIAKAGGFISSQKSSGGYNTAGDYYSAKYTSLTVKIPAAELNAFLDGAAAYANVTNLSKTSDDITSAYLDTEARLESLEAQKTRLSQLMEQAGSLSELLETEDRITQVIYEIESYTKQMNHYKDLVAFSSVTIQLREVETYTVKKEGFFTRLGSAFTEGWGDFIDGLGDFVIGLIYVLPQLILFGALLYFVIRFLRRRRERRGRDV